ncbi:hypothetical protein Leryth_012721 [Lithospermum erythrorhizon]|nr:hypothetical protein Leryth_012721 [Lithospermum erythrorhizon]
MEKADLIKNVSSSIIDEEANEKKKARGVTTTRGSSSNNSNPTTVMRCCQADKCTTDLTDAKQYHRRHKCSRFHEISEFDESKRSCRRRLAGHNERRRKNTGDHPLQFSHGETNSNRKNEHVVTHLQAHN